MRIFTEEEKKDLTEKFKAFSNEQSPKKLNDLRIEILELARKNKFFWASKEFGLWEDYSADHIKNKRDNNEYPNYEDDNLLPIINYIDKYQ